MNRHPELDRIETSAAAAFAFAPCPPPPSNQKNLNVKALALLVFFGGVGAVAAAFIATRPYQLETQIAKEQAATAKQEAAAAAQELSRVRRCLTGGN